MNDLLHGIFKLEVHASLRAEEVFRVGPVVITNSTLMAWAAMLVLVTFAYLAGRNPQLVPSGAQNVFESILEALLTLVENTAGHYARQVFPLIATLFIFIITANYMGLLPGVGTILVRNPHFESSAHAAPAPGFGLVSVAEAAPAAAPAAAPVKAEQKKEARELEFIPLFRAANADVNMTLGMGLIAFFFIHFSGFRVHGLWGYIRDDLANPPMMLPVKLIIECFVPVSLSMRLFGNIFGGEMLMTVMAYPLVAVPFMFMELLFGLIQALIFSMLTLIFTSLASHLPEGHAAGEHGAHGADAPGGHGPTEEHHGAVAVAAHA